MLVSSKRIARNAYASVMTNGTENPVCESATKEISAPIPITARSFKRHKNSIGVLTFCERCDIILLDNCYSARFAKLTFAEEK